LVLDLEFIAHFFGNYLVNNNKQKKKRIIYFGKKYFRNISFFLIYLGWEPNTFGYHGDDGKKFRSSSSKGHSYGPPFTTGDTIGCGINFFNKTAFYTKNGICLGNIIIFINLSNF
jgi:hypothetical protein